MKIPAGSTISGLLFIGPERHFSFVVSKLLPLLNLKQLNAVLKLGTPALSRSLFDQVTRWESIARFGKKWELIGDLAKKVEGVTELSFSLEEWKNVRLILSLLPRAQRGLAFFRCCAGWSFVRELPKSEEKAGLEEIYQSIERGEDVKGSGFLSLYGERCHSFHKNGWTFLMSAIRKQNHASIDALSCPSQHSCATTLQRLSLCQIDRQAMSGSQDTSSCQA